VNHPIHTTHSAVDSAWSIVLAASALAEPLEQRGRTQWFELDDQDRPRGLDRDTPHVVVTWHPESGWRSRLAPDDPRSALLDLYLPLCAGTTTHPLAVGHLGQSLDGFIATHAGDSQFVTGNENLVHLHRLRALFGAVVVGAGTVAADDPQLTTRYVSGPNPLRVVFDPSRRLTPDYRVFTDSDAETLYVCGRSRVADGETHVGRARIAAFDDSTSERDVTQLVGLLRARGCRRVFVEGGGVTVSAFLEANLLDRVHIAIAPVFIGDGRPAIRLPPHLSLRDCRRPAYRVFRMGGDVLFDCDLRATGQQSSSDVDAPLTRII
jgi:diaminohydroxyphosphoribosylaminopyrimidine deaminase / 5-amino-6-(5-phosphoribosylamino)uracil reductase